MKSLFNKVSSKWRRVVEKWRAAENTHEKTDSTRGQSPFNSDDLDIQKQRHLKTLRGLSSDLEKYIYLSDLQTDNENLFFQIAAEHLEEIMPLIYTPTVGEACEKFSELYQKPKGLYITPQDKGHIRDMLENLTQEDVRAIVITDGERILGLGDLGANGMGIPLGKLALYTACGGIDPAQTLPVMFDVGTNNDALRKDPLYIGYPHARIDGAEYDALMAEFVTAVQDKFPDALIQFEDFTAQKAFALLDKYQEETLCFNDDIQGTAAVVLAGVYGGAEEAGVAFEDLRIMFVGAGSAATGIGDLMVAALQEKGLSEKEARARLSFIDSQGLVTTGRDHLAAHKKNYAQDMKEMDVLEAIETLKPHILIGATGQAGSFTKEMIEKMSEHQETPILFALSNPTSHAECSAEQAYRWSNGKAIFASGSPFDAVTYKGKTHQPGQANNAYIFPGLGLGAIAGKAKKVNTDMFLSAAKALASTVTAEDKEQGRLYPPLKKMRAVSRTIAKAVMRSAEKHQLNREKLPDDLDRFLDKVMYTPFQAETKTAQSAKPQKKKRSGYRR